jgi:hypothetical protein
LVSSGLPVDHQADEQKSPALSQPLLFGDLTIGAHEWIILDPKKQWPVGVV